MSQPRGLFIVVEGLDRSGKTTQINLLHQYFINRAAKLNESLSDEKQYKAIQMHFPDRETESGVVLDNYLRKKTELTDEEAHLLFSKNRWEKADFIKQSVEKENTIIICSRYAYSGAVYTHMKGVQSLEWCMDPDRGLPAPDLVIFLNIDPELAAQRSEYGEERYDNVQTQGKVASAFATLLKNDSSVTYIDASQTAEKMHEQIVLAVEAKWKEVGEHLDVLWKSS